MKKMLRRILSFVMLVCIAFMGVFTMPMVSAKAADGTWTLVTDVSTLAEGDQVVIAAKDYDYALSTNQKPNNRGQAAITKTGNTITFEEDVQVLTLSAGNVSGTFAFNTGSGYLCAASSSSNYLRTQDTLNNDGSWKISITEGVASVVAQGDYTRNVMQYNQSSSLFACYASASQKAICLYKLSEGDTSSVTVSVEASMSLSYQYKATQTTEIVQEAFFEKVTEAPTDWSGTYLIVYEDGNVAFNGGLPTLDAINNTIKVEIKDGQIEANANTNAAKFTIAAVDGGYTIQSASNHYIGQTSDANGLKSDETTAYTNTISLNDDGTVNIVSGGAYLRYNAASNQCRFRYYSSSTYTGQKAIYLYKHVKLESTTEKTVTTFSGSEFQIRCGVDASVADIADIDAYGIQITAGGKTVQYTENATSWGVDAENNMLYVVISLGDIINDIEKLGTEFTVRAYVVVGEDTYSSMKSVTYSVASMIKYYSEELELTEVEQLYNYFDQKGLI